VKSYAVIGAGFGDEGKGLVTDWLCYKTKKPLVVRFSGGHQAGHQVVTELGHHHVFSNFGSGTLRGVPTYWSKYCTMDPIGIVNELRSLLELGLVPTLYIDAKCPVTTPFDVKQNIDTEQMNRHGSCGLGVGATYRREENHYSLLFEDLFNPVALGMKLQLICNYYGNLPFDLCGEFLDCCGVVTNSRFIQKVYSMPVDKVSTIIFEGSQGLLLDQHFGFFPHVTPSNTGMANIIEMGFNPEIFIVTRAYQTRHGNGPMTNEQYPHNIKDNPHEQNGDHIHQGKFRKTLLDMNLLEYGINKDIHIRNSKKKSLVITCLDLIQNEYRFTVDGQLVYCNNEFDFIKRVSEMLKMDKVFVSRTPVSKFIGRVI